MLTSAEDATIYERSRRRCLSLRVPRRVFVPMIVDIDDAVMRIIRERPPEFGCSSTMRPRWCESAGLRRPHCASSPPGISMISWRSCSAPPTRFRSGRTPRRQGRPAAQGEVPDRQQLRAAGPVGRQRCAGIRCHHALPSAPVRSRLQDVLRLPDRAAPQTRPSHVREPEFAGRPVTSIAYDVGFGDLSYFNRCFRRAYGATPSGVRSGEALLTARGALFVRPGGCLSQCAVFGRSRLLARGVGP